MSTLFPPKDAEGSGLTPTVRSPSTVVGVLLRQESLLFVLARLGARLWMVISPIHWVEGGWLVLLAVAAVSDIVLGAWAWRGLERRLRYRWVGEVGEAAAWAVVAAADQPYTAATLLVVPLLLATTVRRGMLTGVVAASGAVAVFATARVVAGANPFVVDGVLYVAIAVLAGAAVSTAIGRAAHRARRAADDVIAAESSAAYIVGRNHVITRVGTQVIDDLPPTILAMGVLPSDAARILSNTIRGHKSRLAEETRPAAQYLELAVSSYAAVVRRDDPAVDNHVRFQVRQQDRTLVLRRSQVAALHRWLVQTRPTGTVEVAVEQEAPGNELHLRIGADRLVIPGAPLSRVRLSMVPASYLLLGLFALTMSNPVYAGVPLTTTVPCALTCFALGGLLAVWPAIRDPKIERVAALAALIPFLGVAALVSETTPPGPLLVVLGPLGGLALLLGAVHRPVWAVTGAVAELALATYVTITLATDPDPRHVAAELIWPTVMYVGSLTITRALHRLGVDLQEQYQDDDRATLERSRTAGARSELEYLDTTLSQVEELVGTTPDGPNHPRARERLRTIRALLDDQYRGLA